MLPVVVHNILESARLLGNASRVLADKAIDGFQANEERIADLAEKNPILVTALNPVIGHEKGAAVAKKSYAERRKLNPDFHFSFGAANHRVVSDTFIYAGLNAIKALRRHIQWVKNEASRFS